MQRRVSILLTCGDPTIRSDDPEPAIRDILDDPVLMSLMRSDRVSRAELLLVIDAARAQLHATRLAVAD